MILTNNKNLPQSVMRAIGDNLRMPQDGRYSVTEILKPIQEIILSRQRYNDIVTDVADMLDLLIGSAVHDYIAKYDTTGQSEVRLEWPITDNMYLTGQYDLYDAETFTLVDYKTASVWKAIYADYDDYRLQGLMYAWLLRKYGNHVEYLKFHIILKDWSETQAERQANYPPAKLVTWEHHIDTADMLEIEQFIIDRFAAISAGKLTDCTDDERWYTGTKYAAMGKSRAIKVCDTHAEAEALSSTVEVRTGIYKKCERYCSARDFCEQRRRTVSAEKMEETNNG